MTKWFGVVTIFPEMFHAISQYGITKQALTKGVYELEVVQLRDFSSDKWRRIDERPFGGGPGMIMQVEPLERAVLHLKQQAQKQGKPVQVVLLSPAGKTFSHKASLEFANSDFNYIFVCGRYEGIDQRFIDAYVDQEWSIGDYVLTGGELGAMVMIDAIIRHLPDSMNTRASVEQDSFAHGFLDCAHYTRPEVYEGQLPEHLREIPPVLLSGNHRDIAVWREQEALKRTYERRPDLLQGREQKLTVSQQRYLAQLQGVPFKEPKRGRSTKHKPTAYSAKPEK